MSISADCLETASLEKETRIDLAKAWILVLDRDVETFLKKFHTELCNSEVRDFYDRVLQVDQALEGILVAIKDRLSLLAENCQ